MARLASLSSARVNTNSDFLGRATVPPVAVLHPPPRGVESPITLPLLSNNHGTNQERAIDADTDAGTVNPPTAERGSNITTAAVPAVRERNDGNGSPPKPIASGVHGETPPGGGGVGGGGTGNFASRMMQNVQRHFEIGDAITGTLTVSLELLEYGDGEGGPARGEGVREPGVPPAPAGYAAAKIKVAEDADEARRRREREGIQVPRILSRAQALHDRLGGDATPRDVKGCVVWFGPILIRRGGLVFGVNFVASWRSDIFRGEDEKLLSVSAIFRWRTTIAR